MSTIQSANESTTHSSASASWLETISNLRGEENRLTRAMFARCLNNYVWIRAQFGETGEFTGKDIEQFLTRFSHDLLMSQQLLSGHESFVPKTAVERGAQLGRAAVDRALHVARDE